MNLIRYFVALLKQNNFFIQNSRKSATNFIFLRIVYRRTFCVNNALSLSRHLPRPIFREACHEAIVSIYPHLDNNSCVAFDSS